MFVLALNSDPLVSCQVEPVWILEVPTCAFVRADFLQSQPFLKTAFAKDFVAGIALFWLLHKIVAYSSVEAVNGVSRHGKDHPVCVN